MFDEKTTSKNALSLIHTFLSVERIHPMTHIRSLEIGVSSFLPMFVPFSWEKSEPLRGWELCKPKVLHPDVMLSPESPMLQLLVLEWFFETQ